MKKYYRYLKIGERFNFKIDEFKNGNTGYWEKLLPGLGLIDNDKRARFHVPMRRPIKAKPRRAGGIFCTCGHSDMHHDRAGCHHALCECRRFTSVNRKKPTRKPRRHCGDYAVSGSGK